MWMFLWYSLVHFLKGDNDSHCEEGLRCYQRNSGFDPVPGCSGAGVDNWDYCTVKEDGMIWHLGNSPPTNPKLGRCEGDCEYILNTSIFFSCYNC